MAKIICLKCFNGAWGDHLEIEFSNLQVSRREFLYSHEQIYICRKKEKPICFPEKKDSSLFPLEYHDPIRKNR